MNKSGNRLSAQHPANNGRRTLQNIKIRPENAAVLAKLERFASTTEIINKLLGQVDAPSAPAKENYNIWLKSIAFPMSLSSSEIAEVVAEGGISVSRNRAHCWCRSESHHDYAPMTRDEFNAFCMGLRSWLPDNSTDNNQGQ
ncbi:TPA: DUF1456 family protein [Salmonella enterica]|nr:DUF1456 family protein [Salmonella enterica]